MGKKQVLGIVIKSKAGSDAFEESLLTTLDSIISQPDYDEQQLAVFVTDSCGQEELAGLCRKAAAASDTAASVIPVSADGINDAVNGCGYALLMESGDTLEEEALPVLLKLAKKKKYSAVCLNKDLELNLKKVRSDFFSCGVKTTPPVLTGRGIMIKSELLTDIPVLLEGDMASIAEFIKLTIRAGGYYMCYDASYHIGAAASGYDPDPLILKEMVDYTKKEYPGAVFYAESCIISLIKEYNETVREHDISAARKCLELVDDKTILAYQDTNFHEERNLLRLKYDKDIMEDAEIADDGNVYWHGIRLFSVVKKQRFRFNIIEIENDTMYITGTTDLNMLGDGYKLFVSEDDGTRHYLTLEHDPPRDIKSITGELLHEAQKYEVSIALRDECDLEVIMEDPDGRQFVLNPRMGKFSHLTDWDDNAYFIKNGYIVYAYYGKLIIRKASAGAHLKAELKFMGQLNRLGRYKVTMMRLAHYGYHLFQRKPVWIVADRPHIANDNGEHFFKYLMTQTDMPKKRDVEFVLQKTSKDYDRLRAIGPVLDYGSFKHKMKFFEATKIISAAANDLEVKLLGNSQAYYRNLCKFDFVYLRHGVAKDDQSKWLNKLQKNIRIILSTSTREHDAIIAGAYGYTEREVKMTGLPRFDNLYDERQKKITILPTWRKNIEGERRKGTAKRGYIVDFKDTDYFKFYNALINDERLLDAMKKHGFTGSFYLHPVLESQLGNFRGNDVIEVGSTVADYQTLFRESSIMVTDFSSVAFDFAYLKKPLVYSQFDEATFYVDHSWDRGYFTYREDGFGPITNTVDETVDALIHYMENGCQMEEMYVKRVEDFFPYTDRNNCERVFAAICEAEQGL